MILVIGTFRLPSENRKAARSALERIIALSRAEPGCIDYAYAEDVLEPGLYRVSEAWTDRQALAAHFASPHMQAWRLEREALGMTGRVVTAYTAETAETL
jgi:quinol monooxygenase YgiN